MPADPRRIKELFVAALDLADKPARQALLDRGREQLARLEPRQATLVECRFFGGLEIAEAAALLDVSESTALRDWRAARAWLAAELRRA